MAVYQFPDNELQNIESLVDQLSGGDSGLNQMYNPDESSSLAGEQAMAILKCLQDIHEHMQNDEYADMAKAVNAFEDVVFQMKRIPVDSNPLLYEVLKKSQQMVFDIKDNPEFKVAIRKHAVNARIKHFDNLLYPAQAAHEIQELIQETITNLQNENKNRNTPITSPAEKKSFFSKFFPPKTNKILDSSQIQRIPKMELDEIVFFLNGLASAMPSPSDARWLDTALAVTVRTLQTAIDNIPTTSSPLILNALSRLAAKLQDYLIYMNGEDKNISGPAAKTYADYVNVAFENFIKTDAGKHFQLVAINPGTDSPYTANLTSEELENFNNLTDEDFNSRETVLLALLPEDKFNDFKFNVDAEYERYLDDLTSSDESIMPIRRDSMG